MSLTLSQFVHQILASLSHARERADTASRDIAKRYLEDDHLIGFPTPRMTINTVDLDLVFRAVDQDDQSHLLALEETHSLIHANLSDSVYHLIQTADFATEIEVVEAFWYHWQSARESFLDTMQAAAKASNGLRDSFGAAIQMVLLGFFQELRRSENHDSRLVELLFEHVETDLPSDIDDYRTNAHRQNVWIRKAVEAALSDALPGQDIDNAFHDLKILVGAAQLDHLEPSTLQRIKLTVAAQDRKWVAVKDGDEKRYILDK